MLQLGQLSAWIVIGGVEGPEAKEYNIETTDDSKSATCWIASEEGTRFSIHWRNAGLPGSLVGRVLVDGNKCGSKVTSGPRSTSKDSIIASSEVVRPFIFSSLDVTDDDAYLERTSGDIGTIKLEVWDVEITGTEPCWGLPIPADQKVHERSKKAMTHQIKFGDPEPCVNQVYVTTKEIGAHPRATFSFKYRSLDVLRANGIVPPLRPGKRKADTLGSDCDTNDQVVTMVEDSDVEEEARLLERINAIRAKRAKSSGSRKKIKREKDHPIPAGEIIDLT